MTLCAAYLTPYGMTERRLTLLSEPVWTRSEQGGFQDATLHAVIDEKLRDRVRGAAVEIQTPFGTKYFGRVRSLSGDYLICEGQQLTLGDTRIPRAYVMAPERWKPWDGRYADSNAYTVEDDGSFEVTFSSDSTYKAGRGAYFIVHFPAPTSVARLVLEISGLYSNNYEVFTYYAQNYSLKTWTQIRAVTDGSNDTYTDDLTAENMTSLLIKVSVEAETTPGADRTVVLTPTVYGTSVTSATAANIAAHLLSAETFTDVEAITDTLTDFVLDTKATTLTAFSDLLKYGDWRYYTDARLKAGVYQPCHVFASRATTPKYRLIEGDMDGGKVTCEIDGPTTDGLYSAVRVHYSDSVGRPRYRDRTDSDYSHYLVWTGQTRTADLDADTRSSSAADDAGDRYLVDKGRDVWRGTVTIEGSPGGIPACDFDAGELVTIVTRRYGEITARLTDGTYSGAYQATFALDNTPATDAAIARILRH